MLGSAQLELHSPSSLRIFARNGGGRGGRAVVELMTVIVTRTKRETLVSCFRTVLLSYWCRGAPAEIAVLLYWELNKRWDGGKVPAPRTLTWLSKAAGRMPGRKGRAAYFHTGNRADIYGCTLPGPLSLFFSLFTVHSLMSWFFGEHVVLRHRFEGLGFHCVGLSSWWTVWSPSSGCLEKGCPFGEEWPSWPRRWHKARRYHLSISLGFVALSGGTAQSCTCW